MKTYFIRGNSVFINHTERVEAKKLSIIITCKTKSVIGIQPSMVSMSSLITLSYFDGHVSLDINISDCLILY